MQPNRKRIGFLGLGAMGAPMARRLVAAGHEVVVWNRSSAPTEPFLAAGVRVARTPAEVAATAEVICSCLLGQAAIEQVYFGADGLFDSITAGSIIVEHATFDPDAARQLAARTAERGVVFIDAPISGGAEAAAAGTLVVMLGGDRSVADRVLPLLESYATAIEWVGPSGAGLTLKLLNQMMVTVHSAAAAELAATLRGLDYDPIAAGRALGHGWAGSAMLARNLPLAFAAGLADPSNAPIAGLAEAQRLLTALTKHLGVAAPVFQAAITQFQRATDAGLGRSDLAALTLLNRGPA